jgi:hypothetical protein
MLISHQFLLFFEVLYDLPEGLFEYLNLALEDLDLLLLCLSTLIILVDCTKLKHVLSLRLLVLV